ncbi:MAG: phosphatase PAP2 family protein [Phycisphaeraceae bacterium]
MAEPPDNAPPPDPSRVITDAAQAGPAALPGGSAAAPLAAIVTALLALALLLILTLALMLNARPAPLQWSLAFGILIPAYLIVRRLRRRAPRIALGLATLATVLSLAFVGNALTALIAMHGVPLVDPQLAAIDRALGVDAAAWIAWAQKPALLNYGLFAVYESLMPQTVLIALLYARRHDVVGSWRFALQLLLAVFATILLFRFFPAVGPSLTPETAPTAFQNHYISLFNGLHTGEDRTIHLFIFTGLVTFPSFHAAWAVILTAAFRPWPKLLPAAVVLNSLVLVTAVTHGCHYVIDILVGIAIGTAALMLPTMPMKVAPSHV